MSGRYVSDLDCGRASINDVGGKAKNLAILRDLARVSHRIPAEEFHVPQGVVIRRQALSHVFEAPTVRGLVGNLDQLLGESSGSAPRDRALQGRVHALLAELRGAICSSVLPGPVEEAILNAYELLRRSPAAVRSSAIVEDSRHASAAGVGLTKLNVSDATSILTAVREVWASSVAFFERGLCRPGPCMAVVLQRMVDEPAASGVLFSVNPLAGRPGFLIEACGGLGEGVVNGSELASRWFVSPDAECVLECQDHSSKMMTTKQVLHLARAGALIREHYVRQGLAAEVDVEFAFARDGALFILQARPETSGSRRNPSLHISDRQTRARRAVAGGAPGVIRLAGICASPGAVTGKLQIIEDPNRFELAQPGAIVVVSNTANSWTAVIPALAAVITEEGNLLSHAAVTAREGGTPGLVASCGAIERLRAYDGRHVTFDAQQRVLVLDRVPIVEVGATQSVWVPRDQLPAIATTKRQMQESEWSRPAWERLQQYGVAWEDWEGRFVGKPKRPYCAFQLDVYTKGWDRLDVRLNQIIAANPPVRHPKPYVKGGILFFRLEEETNYPMPALSEVGLDALATLLEARRTTFTRGGEFFESMTSINTENVPVLVELLPELLSHMHCALRLSRALFEHAEHQLQYVQEEMQPLLLDLALRHDPNLAPGDRRSVLRQKLIALDMLAEEILAAPQRIGIFMQESAFGILDALQRKQPALLAEVRGLSRRFKHGSEDLRRLDDTDVHLFDLRERVAAGSRVTRERLVEYCEEFIAPGGGQSVDAVWTDIQSACPDLARLVTAYAERTGGDVRSILGDVRGEWQSRDGLVETLDFYPGLRHLLSLARQAAHMRDDAHELITRWQRQLAPLMLQAGKKGVVHAVLTTAEDVFDLSLQEFAALVQAGPAAACLARSPDRRRRLEAAEQALTAALTSDTAEINELDPCQRCAAALRSYRAELEQIERCLKHQAQEAKRAGSVILVEEYGAEIARLAARFVEVQQSVCAGCPEPDRNAGRASMRDRDNCSTGVTDVHRARIELIGFQRHDLNDEHQFWVGQLPEPLGFAPSMFEELWQLHPSEFGEIYRYGRPVKLPRWVQAFGKDYHFSGQTSKAVETPSLLAPLLAWVRQCVDDRLNGILVNWYDGALGHYIGPHRDSRNRKKMIEGAPIVTISLGEERTFRLRPYGGCGERDFAARDGTVFVMPYATNLAWTHEVLAGDWQLGRRISVTLRGFCDGPAIPDKRDGGAGGSLAT